MSMRRVRTRLLVLGIWLMIVGALAGTALGATLGLFSNQALVQSSGAISALTLSAPGAGSTSSPTASSLTISWVASSNLPTGGTYEVFRSTSSGTQGPELTSGGCAAPAVSPCTDAGLSLSTTYYYEVEAVYQKWVTQPNTQFSGTTLAAFSATDLGNITSACTISSHSCTGPSVTTTNNRTELILVSATGTSSASTTIASITGPFTGALAVSGASVKYPTGNNYLFAWKATGNGTGPAAVTVVFDTGTTSGSALVDVVQLGLGYSPLACSACANSGTNSGGSKVATVAVSVSSATDSEVAFLGTADNSTFLVPSPQPSPAFSSLAGATGFGTFDDSTVQASAAFKMGNANKSWGSLALEISP